MIIKINGQEKEFNKEITINELITLYKLKHKAVVVELNNTIVQPSDYEKTKIKNNDVIELVRFVGGG